MNDGLIHAFVISVASGVRRLEWDEVHAWSPEQGLLWVHLDASSERTGQWIYRASGLTRLVAQALLARETRPRVSSIGDGALILLRGVNLNPGAEPEDMVSIRLWVEGSPFRG